MGDSSGTNDHLPKWHRRAQSSHRHGPDASKKANGHWNSRNAENSRTDEFRPSRKTRRNHSPANSTRSDGGRSGFRGNPYTNRNPNWLENILKLQREQRPRTDENDGESKPLPSARCKSNRNWISTSKRNTKPKNFVIAKSCKKKSSQLNSSDSEDDSSDKVYIGYKYLIDCLNKEPIEALCEILRPKTPFQVFLDEPDLEPEMLFLVIQLIKSLCSVNFTENKCELLNRICRSRLLVTISNYLGDVRFEESMKVIKNLKLFILNLEELLGHIVVTLPTQACVNDLKKLIEKIILAIKDVNLKFAIEVEETCVERLLNSIERIDEFRASIEKKSRPKTADNPGTRAESLNIFEDVEPPNNFRELELYPTAEELKQESFGFLRANRISGGYTNVEQYLDIQYRLLREDFVDPLRQGLKKYITFKFNMLDAKDKRKMKSKFDNIRLYEKTKFESFDVTERNEVGLVLRFNSNPKFKVKWEYSKRLKFGTLLLFTKDDFTTFFYGSVLDRNIKQLEQGQTLVSLPDNVRVDKEFFNEEFLMAESEVFFEPYFLVMKALKTLTEENFPMPNYIVYGDSETKMPDYVLDEFKVWNILGYNLDPGQRDGWPSAVDLELDDSQYEAFKTALTNDFCIIQGPPGTGKTFLGLKIVEVLLMNKTVNVKALHTPILVVCYTNHALDQFLEGIMKYTKNIIRAGSQSKSEILQGFNLRGKGTWNTRQQVKRYLNANMYLVRQSIEHHILEIKFWTEQKNLIELPKGIVTYRYLSKVMSDTVKREISSDHILWNWLLPVKIQDDELSYPREIDLHQILGKNNQVLSKEEMLIEWEEDQDDRGLFEESIEPVPKAEDNPEKTCYFKTLDMVAEEYEKMYVEYKKLEESLINQNVIHDLRVELEMRQLIKKMKVNELQCRMLKEHLSNINYVPTFRGWEGRSVLHLPLEGRWKLYWYWVVKVREYILSKMRKSQEKYRSHKSQFEEYKQMEDLHVIKTAKVVGMTTTCAARLSPLLRSLKPQIVIVEEAAEVLESHIVTSLTDKCQHVILIGDHKQLRPNAAAYSLCRDYKFDVSLFERMVNNQMYCPTLNVQHRMRPEISELITPLIYPDLKDHESVLKFESIRGMRKNLYFFEHNEQEQKIQDTSSRSNLFESEFALSLCKYLILQGYEQQKITILTTYTGQMYLLREKKRSNPLMQHVSCIVVDKYQGEENDIIILSLVRSNEECKIGFLGIPNRVCVALSRARMGFYIIGNMDTFCGESKLWRSIKATLEKRDEIGRKLVLYCDRHDKETIIAQLDDFGKVEEGGCQSICGDLLSCGHMCKRMCHQMDREHNEFKCREKCDRTCPKVHPCHQLCFEKCDPCMVVEEQTLECGHTKTLHCHVNNEDYRCDEILNDVSPWCGHAITRLCWQKPDDIQCSVPCGARLDCGHSCSLNCHVLEDADHTEFKCRKPCAKKNFGCLADPVHICVKKCFENCDECTIQVKKTLPCGHPIKTSCSTSVNEAKCKMECGKPCADCHKPCKKLCHVPCAPCFTKVKKKIEECGHIVNMGCAEMPTRSRCNRKCERMAPCGHKCRDVCSKPCGELRCEELVKVPNVQGLCGHEFVKVPCSLRLDAPNLDKKTLLRNCDEACGTKLKCGDQCAGTCGQCWQKRLHKSCQKKCDRVLICGHSCRSPCQKVCPPCTEACMTKCKHSECRKKCGIPCTRCKEKCDWGCEHSKCTMKCGELCNREPCYEPCKNILKCEHPCVGFCGEPCPPVCRVCNPEITEIFLGFEDEDDARFVYLQDCGHTIESQGLEAFLKTNQENGEIVAKTCPRCKSLIATTMRFMNVIKKTHKHVMGVKKKVYGNAEPQKRKELSNHLKDLSADISTLFSKLITVHSLFDIRMFKKTINEYVNLCAFNPKKLTKMPSSAFSAVQYWYELYSTIISLLTRLIDQENQSQSDGEKIDLCPPALSTITYIRHVINETFKIKMNVNSQYCDDFSCEVNRFGKMVDLCKLFRDPLYKTINVTKKREVDDLFKDIEDRIFSNSRFVAQKEEVVDQLFQNFLKEIQSSQQVGLTPEEKVMINQAMAKDFMGGINSKGHWFTCSNGHYYCITECGGAVQRSKCPECEECIGGSNHQITHTSRLASDMDGATHPAWSTHHDMRNFGFRF